MVRTILILIMAVCAGASLYAQSWSEAFVIHWNKPLSAGVEGVSDLRFEEQTGRDERGLPLLSVTIPLEDSVFSADQVQVSFQVKETTALNAIEAVLFKDIGSNELRCVQKHMVTIRKKKFLELLITPLQYDPALHLWFKVSRFELMVETSPINTYNINTVPGTIKRMQASNSVLANGQWLKVSVTESGVHKIPYSVLTSWGFQNPARVKVYGNGGRMLPKANDAFRQDDLKENAIWHQNNTLYFYAQGPVAWSYDENRGMFVHQLHDYADEASYFLTEGDNTPKAIATSTVSYDTFSQETGSYDSYRYYEMELRNLISSGRTWYGAEIYAGQEASYSFRFDKLEKDQAIKILTSVIGRSNREATMQSFINQSPVALQTISIPTVTYGDQIGSAAQEGIGQSDFYSNNEDVVITLRYNTSGTGAFSNLNFICLNALERLEYNGYLSFRNKGVVGDGQVVRYNIKDLDADAVLWDVTDCTTPLQLAIEDYGSERGFTYGAGSLKEFVIFNPNGDLPQPDRVANIDNQDLHGTEVPEMLIVSHPLFKEQAERLAQLHLKESGMTCLVVEPGEIYNEFSSGQPDVSAIRDFTRYLYLKDERLKYLLLFGDGSYDNKSDNDLNSNYILTYQSENSINHSNSYASDDFFGFLDANEGTYLQVDKLDIGIGRITVGTAQEAKAVVDKIEAYMFNPYFSPWKTTLTFVGDDGDSNLHMRQADLLTRKLQVEHPEYQIQKIYMDAYKKTTTSSGDRYLDVNEAIQESMASGTLVFNYTGHGSERQLAHENVLSIGDIENFTNFDRLPIFVTATCEFSRYDDKDITGGSAGEIVLKSPHGGGVALLTTTRIAWSSSNFDINSNLYNYLFEKDENGEKLRLGEIIRRTKNASSNTVNKLNFTLLGDPALKVNYPTNNIVLDKINDEQNAELQDTIKALTLVKLEGVIESGDEALFEDGAVDVSVYDKPVKVSTIGNGGAVPFEYEVYQNRIFRGEAGVENNRFAVSFMVPKDIRYNVGNGRVSFYGSDVNAMEAFGASNTVLVGGINNSPSADSEGPEIKVWLNDTGFQDGAETGTRPVLYAALSDESGINASGVGIGHDLTLVVNDNRPDALVLNDYYTARKDNYKEGSLQYQLPTMEAGSHVLHLKAWDNQNNSTTVEVNFKVVRRGELKIEEVLVFPNPVHQGEKLMISFNHDAPNSRLDATIRLFDLSGRKLSEDRRTLISAGAAVAPFEFDLPSGLTRGFYILNGDFKAEEGQQGRWSKKILVIK